MRQCMEYLSEFNAVSIFFRLFLAVVFGGIIGLERRLRKRAAGLRTFALVCAGAALAMITNEYIFLNHSTTADPGRMAAQVISGVGFLGAGTIILNGKQVKGLTTAASLWATAAVGIALGSGFFIGAFFGFFIIFISTTFMYKLEEKAAKDSKFILLYVELKKDVGISEIIKYIAEKNFKLYSIEKSDKKKQNNNLCVSIEIDMKKRVEHGEIISEINLLDSVIYTEEIK